MILRQPLEKKQIAGFEFINLLDIPCSTEWMVCNCVNIEITVLYFCIVPTCIAIPF
jgi:hypothetical protein